MVRVGDTFPFLKVALLYCKGADGIACMLLGLLSMDWIEALETLKGGGSGILVVTGDLDC